VLGLKIIMKIAQYLLLILSMAMVFDCKKVNIDQESCQEIDSLNSYYKNKPDSIREFLSGLEDSCYIDGCIELLKLNNRVDGKAIGAEGMEGIFYWVKYTLKNIGDESLFISMAQDKSAILNVMGILCLLEINRDKYFSIANKYLNDKRKLRYLPVGCIETEETVGYIIKKAIQNKGL
jgi:hypothetical protein